MVGGSKDELASGDGESLTLRGLEVAKGTSNQERCLFLAAQVT